MGASMATVNAITKDVYGPRIVDQLEHETTALKRIEKTSRGTVSETGGKFVTFPLKVRRNSGIGYRNELEKLQDAGQQGWTNVRVPLRFGYGRVHLTGQAIDLVQENYQAFSSAITEEMEGLKNDIKKDTNRIIWGNGVGVLGTVATAAATANTVDVGTSYEDVKFFDLDMMVDILSSDGLTVRASNRKVTAINEATGVITVNGAADITTSVGDIVTRAGNYKREPNGFANLIAGSGVVHGLDPANEPLWKSVEDNSGGTLSEGKMIAMCDRLRQNGGRPSVIFADLASRRAYFNLLKGERRFTNTQEFDGGFKGLAFSYDDDIPLVTDVDAPAGKMWFVDEDKLTVYRRKPWYWEDKDGSVWKWVNDYDAFEALLKQYWELAIERRNTSGVMTGITPG